MNEREFALQKAIDLASYNGGQPSATDVLDNALKFEQFLTRPFEDLKATPVGSPADVLDPAKFEVKMATAENGKTYAVGIGGLGAPQGAVADAAQAGDAVGIKGFAGLGLGVAEARHDQSACADCTRINQKLKAVGHFTLETRLDDIAGFERTTRSYFRHLGLFNLHDVIGFGPSIFDKLAVDDAKILAEVVKPITDILEDQASAQSLDDFVQEVTGGKNIADTSAPRSDYGNFLLSDFSSLTSETVGELAALGYKTIGDITYDVFATANVLKLSNKAQAAEVLKIVATNLSADIRTRDDMPEAKKAELLNRVGALREFIGKAIGDDLAQQDIEPEPPTIGVGGANVEALVEGLRSHCKKNGIKATITVGRMGPKGFEQIGNIDQESGLPQSIVNLFNSKPPAQH